MEKQENKPNRTTITLFLLLLLSATVNVILYKNNYDAKQMVQQQSDSIDSLVIVKVELDREIEETTEELQRYKGMYENLDSLLTIANSKIEEQKKKINSLAKQAADVKKLKAQLDELRKLKDSLLDQVDSLIQENKKLKTEKEGLEQSVATLEGEKAALTQKVEIASVLKVGSMKVTPYKKRSSGKFTETSLAKRTKRIEVCADIMDNAVALKGPKAIYLRIVSPQGVTLAMGTESFKILGTGEESRYTSTSTIDYNGDKMNTCLYWEQEGKFDPGTYKVEVYCEGYLSGAGQLDLK